MIEDLEQVAGLAAVCLVLIIIAWLAVGQVIAWVEDWQESRRSGKSLRR
jgi:hypothetical protein